MLNVDVDGPRKAAQHYEQKEETGTQGGHLPPTRRKLQQSLPIHPATPPANPTSPTSPMTLHRRADRSMCSGPLAPRTSARGSARRSRPYRLIGTFPQGPVALPVAGQPARSQRRLLRASDWGRGGRGVMLYSVCLLRRARPVLRTHATAIVRYSVARPGQRPRRNGRSHGPRSKRHNPALRSPRRGSEGGRRSYARRSLRSPGRKVNAAVMARIVETAERELARWRVDPRCRRLLLCGRILLGLAAAAVVFRWLMGGLAPRGA